MNQTLLHPPDDETEVLMDNLAKLFGVDITRIVKYLGDPPIYYMYTEQGNITLGKIENLMSQERFRALTAAATEVVIPSVGKKIWEQRVQAMLLACEQTPVGDASHPAQETNAWLEEYLLEKPPREGMNGRRPRRPSDPSSSTERSTSSWTTSGGGWISTSASRLPRTPLGGDSSSARPGRRGST